MIAGLRRRLDARIEAWVDRRQPVTPSESLSQRNLYILPAGDGIKFLVLVMMIWLMGTNYENNLVLLLSFILIAVFVSAIFATHANLSGIHLSVGDVEPVFAGSLLRIPIELDNPSAKARYRIALGWMGEELHELDLPTGARSRAELNLPATRRGRISIPRLRIETRAPLGIMCSWSQPRLHADCIVYPKPIPHEVSGATGGEGGSQQSSGRGTDDFAGLEPWQPGVPTQRIAWKQFSAGRGLLEKRFEAQSHSPKWLDWEDYPGLDHETRLSALCARALEMENLGRSYGLRMPDCLVPPAQGERHLREVLTHLALFQVGSP